MKFRSLLFFLALSLNFLAWVALNPLISLPDWNGKIYGLAYTPHQAIHSYDELSAHPDVTETQIEQDFKLFAGKIDNVRIYAATHGQELIPAVAQRYGVKVLAGAWLNADPTNNRLELDAIVRLAQQYPNISDVLVGNEVSFRKELTIEQLIAAVDQVKAQVKQPVSVGEIWDFWIKHPEIVDHVDFLAAHIFPYWAGKPIEQGIAEIQRAYTQLHTAYPNKRIVIAETGWPSKGGYQWDAKASLVNQARFTREFLNYAKQNNFEYYLMEAFDQPWKHSTEGVSSEHWGLFDVAGRPKFPFAGPVSENPLWIYEAMLSVLLSLIPMDLFYRHGQSIRFGGQCFYLLLIQFFCSLLSYSLFAPFLRGLNVYTVTAWILLLPIQLMLIAVVLVNGFEWVELLWKNRRREFHPLPAQTLTTGNQPKVSLHLAICNEPPDLVIATLNRLSQLDYPNFEVLVVDNNTLDDSLWQPVEACCRQLGEHFRFFTLGKWSGYKAGALNFALAQTDSEAEIIGVVDSDYLVEVDWLKSFVPYFQDPKVGFVQAPQDHRDWQRDTFQEVCNWEYAGFFNIGMVHRNERDAIIQHGTMTLIRKQVLTQIGKWAEWCICEDAELGLSIMERGYQGIYINQAFGKGLTPQTFIGYKKQRFRWAYGAVQILRRHWRSLIGAKSSLTAAQRFHFLTGWLPWFADALSLLLTFGAILWSLALIITPDYSRFPLDMFLITAVCLFIFKILYGLTLYSALVPCTLKQRIGAAIAGMSLTHTIALAIIAGLFTKNQPFLRTAKAENQPAFIQSLLMARGELMMLLLLLLSIIGIIARFNVIKYYAEFDIIWWLMVLSILTLPYISALLMALVNVKPWQKHSNLTK